MLPNEWSPGAEFIFYSDLVFPRKCRLGPPPHVVGVALFSDDVAMMLKTTYKGEALIHRWLWNVVEDNAKIAREREEGWFNPTLVCEVFAFHTVEAYMNFIGERIAPEIWQHERNYFKNEPYRGWDGKLRKVLELVNLNYQPDRAPMSTVVRLRTLRDLIAHGKSETIAGEQVHGLDIDPPWLPASTLRSAVAVREDLPGILADIESLLDDIHKRAAPMVKQRWTGSGKAIWFGTRALRGPGQYSTRSTTPHGAEKPK